ncbi:MAG: insulinase family protein, partial [Pseudomonadota bacterium]
PSVLDRLHSRWMSVRSNNTRVLRDVLNRSLYDLDATSEHILPEVSALRSAHRHFFVATPSSEIVVVGHLPAPLLRHVVRRHLGGLAARADNARVQLEPKPLNRVIRVRTATASADISLHYLQAQDNGADLDAAGLLALRSALERGLWTRLRDELGLVYQVSVQLLRRPFARGGASLVVHTKSSPDAVDQVLTAIDQTVTALQTHQVAEREFDTLKSQLVSDYNRRLDSNRGLMYEFALLREHGFDYADIERVIAAIEATDRAGLKRVARRFFDQAGRTALILSPPVDEGGRARNVALQPGSR